MKYNSLSNERKDLIDKNPRLEVDEKDNIVFTSTQETVPDERMITYLVFSGV